MLNEVEGLLGKQLSSSLVLFEWLSPYTLAGVPILGYELLIHETDELDKDIWTFCNATANETSYIYNKLNESSNCTIVNINISAINMVGHGLSAEYMFTFTASKPMNA